MTNSIAHIIQYRPKQEDDDVWVCIFMFSGLEEGYVITEKGGIQVLEPAFNGGRRVVLVEPWLADKLTQAAATHFADPDVESFVYDSKSPVYKGIVQAIARWKADWAEIDEAETTAFLKANARGGEE